MHMSCTFFQIFNHIVCRNARKNNRKNLRLFFNLSKTHEEDQIQYDIRNFTIFSFTYWLSEISGRAVLNA